MAKQVNAYDPNSTTYNAILRKRVKEIEELIETYESRNWDFSAQEILAVDYDQFKKDEQKAKFTNTLAVPGGFISYIRTVLALHWRQKKNLGNAKKYEDEATELAKFPPVLYQDQVSTHY